jgi:hypothetical protein
MSPSGSPKPLLANAITAFRECLSWQGVLSYDAFGMQAVLDDAPPWHPHIQWTPRAWTPQDDLLAADWMQRQGIGINVATTAQAVEAVARDRQFHPVIDYLESLEHDGEIRTKGWLTRYLGAAPSAYHDQVGRSMLVAAAARILEPGCKADSVPILEGPQGARKSTAIKALFDPWFTDEIADLASKDSAMQTRGVWASRSPSSTPCLGLRSPRSRPSCRARPIGSGPPTAIGSSRANAPASSGVRPTPTPI